MAVKKFTLAESQLVTYRERNYDGEYTYTESIGTGRVGTHSGATQAYERRVWCDFSGIWDESITADKIDSVKLTAGIIGETDNTDVFTVVFRVWNGLSVGDTAEEEKYRACAFGEGIGETKISANTTHAPVYTIAGEALAQFLDWKVIGLAPSRTAEIDDGTEVYADVSVVYIEVTYRDESAKPVISDLSVASGSAADGLFAYTDSLTVAWKYSQDAGLAQSRFDVQMKTEQGNWVDAADGYASAAHSYTVSPGSYPSPYAIGNAVHIRVRAYSTAGVASEWITGLLALVFPESYDLDPSGGEILLGENSTDLRWKVHCEYGGTVLAMSNPPTSYDVEYSSDGGETWNALADNRTAVRDGDGYYITVPGHTFPSGAVRWRVRPRVSGNKLDVWAQESFLVRVQASTSSVSCDGKPHPTVSWVPSSQIAYQVRFADYDSGAVYGTATSHRIPYFYADGAYPVQVRTQADDGKWSAWTEPEYVTIRNTSPAGSLILTVQKTRHAVALEWSGTVFGRYILYRNGIPVYIGSETRYTDPGAHGECTYYVRGIADPNYLQSSSVSVDGSPATDCMYDLATQKWIPLRYSAAPRSRAYSETANAVYKYYAGRKYPVAYLDGTADRQLNVAYCFKTMADADAVREALGHPVIYKDTRGRRIIGIFGSMNETVERRMVLHTLNIVQVDYNEEVRYET